MGARDVWYAGAWSRELRRKPLGRTLLGRRIALFRGADGRVCAVSARCPHRGADLSQGRCVKGAIECPFHGWRFDTRGRCVSIPSQPAEVKIPRDARVDSFEVVEQDGVVWLRADAESRADAPAEPPARELRGRRGVIPPTLVQGSFLTVLENAVDAAHNPFIHRGTFGPKVDPLVPRQRLDVDPDAVGLRAEEDPSSPWRPSGPPITGVYGLAARLLGQTAPTARSTTVQLGGRITTYAEYATGRWDSFSIFLTPATPEDTWVFYESTRTRFPVRAGDPLQRMFMKRILHDGERETSLIVHDPETMERRISVEADRVALAARQLYSRVGLPGELRLSPISCGGMSSAGSIP